MFASMLEVGKSLEFVLPSPACWQMYSIRRDVVTQLESNVVRLPQAFDSPSCRQFFDSWCAISGKNLAPQSAEFLDRAPVELMPYVFIHDIRPEGLLVRFMGTGLVQRWRHDLTGHYFGADLDQHERDRLLETGRLIADHPCGMRQVGGMASSMGRSVRFEAVMLPLRPDPGGMPRTVVFSQILGDMADKEHSRNFEQAGYRKWIDIGHSVPSAPPPS